MEYNEIKVMRDWPSREQEGWRVWVGYRVTSPTFNSRGAALAYADMLREGRRKPEFA